jgi:hypothetical protein
MNPFRYLVILATSLLPCLTLAGCAQPTAAAMAAAGPNTPGWTGSTIVPGSHSTVAGDAQATYDQQKWPLGERP